MPNPERGRPTPSGDNSIPLVTVAIPVYNGEAFVARAIRSALAQDWPAMEIVVVDDGSTDGTRGVVEGIEGPIRYLYQPNSGAAAARNHAVRESRGEFIAFLDADDEWLPGRLRRTIEPMMADPAIGICYTRAWQVFANGERRLMHADAVRKRPQYGIHPPPFITTTSATFRRSVLEQAGTFDETMPQLEDFDLFIRVAEMSKAKEIPEALTLQHDRADGLHAQGDAARRADLILRVAFKALGRTRKKYDREAALAFAFQSAGIQFLDAGQKRRAFHCFMISFGFHPAWRSLFFALRSFLPRSVAAAAKAVKSAG